LKTLLALLVAAALLAGAGWLWPRLQAGFQTEAGTVDPAGSGQSEDLVLDGRVMRVIDGDTLEVRLGSGPERIRLYGIDTPEARAPGGREATQALKRLVAAGAVAVAPVSDDPYDAYDRLIAVLYVGRLNVNEQLLADGHAWAYRRYLGQMDGDTRYCELEATARAGRRGLWSLPRERWVPPWIWRERQKAGLGARVPSKDYSLETAQDCIAAIGKSHEQPSASASSPGVAEPGNDHRAGCDIKGNINSKGARIYHLPGTSSYAATRIDTSRGERWFCSEQEARAAGWRAPGTGP